MLDKTMITAGEGNERSADVEDQNAETDAKYRRDYIQHEVSRVGVDVVESDVVKSKSNDSANPQTHAENSGLREITKDIAHKETADKCQHYYVFDG